MTVTFEGIEGTDVDFSDVSMMPLQDIVELIYDHALKRAHAPGAPCQGSLTPDESFGDSTFLQRFRVGLAHGVARVLAAYDQRVFSAHLFAETAMAEDEVDFCTLPDATARLLVIVGARSAALDALAAALDQALVREVRKLSIPLICEQETLLNPTFITEKDVQQRKGFGLLFSLAYVPSLTIWKRGEGEIC